jgi:periplasmic protein CpxP/Spy
MVRSHTVMIGAAVAGLLVATLAFAQGPRGHGRGPGGPGGFGMGGPGGPFGMGGPGLGLGMADLTDAQEQQVRDIRMRNRDAIQASAEQLRVAHDAQRKAMETLPVDEGQIRAAAQALADVEADVAVQAARLRAEIWAVLTPAQQTQIAKQRETREARMRERQQELRERPRNQQSR